MLLGAGWKLGFITLGGAGCSCLDIDDLLGSSKDHFIDSFLLEGPCL